VASHCGAIDTAGSVNLVVEVCGSSGSAEAEEHHEST
jgi:hypothetical protein